jgi:hypothetical protein
MLAQPTSFRRISAKERSDRFGVGRNSSAIRIALSAVPPRPYLAAGAAMVHRDHPNSIFAPPTAIDVERVAPTSG